MESFGGRRCHLAGNPTCFVSSARTIMSSIGPRSATAYHTCIQHPSNVSLPIHDKRCPNSKSFFTHSSKCYSSYFCTTWPFLSTPARFHLLAVAHSSRIRAPTLRIVEVSGILLGAALSRFFRVHGWRSIRIFLVLRRGRGRIVFKGGYGTHFCRLLSTAFRYSYVHYSYPSTC